LFYYKEFKKGGIMGNFYAARVVGGRELKIIENLYLFGKKYPEAIQAVLWKEQIKGYIFIESEDYNTLNQIIKSIRDIRGLINTPLKEEEINKLVIKEEEEIELLPGDIVEIIVGPFKGERAKVIRIDKGKGEAVVQLLTTTVPIPIDIKLNWLVLRERVANEELIK
jgi:transcriptional antiterminator NusG